jgi:hypothetical protein
MKNGDEEWQKTMGTRNNEEGVSVIQTTDLGYFVAGNVSNSKDGFGSKDALIPFLIQNYWNNNTENLSISEGHRKF